MDSDSFMNPRTLKPGPAAADKPSPTPILDRYRALLKERDDDLRVSPDDDVSPPSTEEIVQLYEMLLSELVFNSKPIITDLTIIAGEQRDHGKGIADAICARILEVPVEHKLPSLYLLDSIVKNIGRDYGKYFSYRLPEVFCEAYRQAHPNQHAAMRHLFGTWTSVFPPAVLGRIESQLQFSPQGNSRASESPRPAHGIHVNPKYLRHLENSNVDSIGSQRLSSTGTMSHTHFPLGSNQMRSSTGRHARSSSPSNIGVATAIDDFESENSPKRFVERASPPNSVFDYRTIGRDEEPSERRRKHYIDGSQNRFDNNASFNNLSNGPRALIDAYGKDRGDRSLNDKPLHVGRLGLNGLGHRATSMPWQNTEEEEFDWENMNQTLTEHRRNNDFLPSAVPPSRRARPGFGTRNTNPLDQLPLNDEEPVPTLAFNRGNISRFQSEINHDLSSRYPQENLNRPFQSSVGQKLSIEKHLDVDARHHGPINVASIMGSGVDTYDPDSRPFIPASVGLRPPVNVHNSHPPPLNPVFPMQNQRNQYGSINDIETVTNQGPYKSLYMPEQQLDARPPVNQRNQLQVSPFQHQFLPPQEQRDSPVPPYSVLPPLNRGYNLRGQSGTSSGLVNQQMGFPTHYIPNNGLHHLRGEALPPLPPGPPPPSHGIYPIQNVGPVVSSNQQGNAYSGLINSLMSQGLISLTNNSALQDSVGVEFNADLLKVRHESAITALYGDLPRQCTTCGLRFKCQEEHSSHMDWHVTKNRMSKNRKQKPSRKWFVTTSMWLSGAEASGTDAVPGFLPADTIAEKKKSDEEMAVPADEDQNTCALCGEPFDDFYSDETEEWMYKGAVYLNAPQGSAPDMDRSQLGPIVHAKCRPESSDASPGGFGQDEGGFVEEGSQRKRLRS